MDDFVLLNNVPKDSNLTNAFADAIAGDIAAHSPKARWMIPHNNARTKMVREFFNDFVIYQSALKPYKFMSNILYQSTSGERNEIQFIGYGLKINQGINSANSINEDENQFLGFIRLLYTAFKYTLLSPLRIGFGNCGGILLMNYNQYLYHDIIFKNLHRAISKQRFERRRHELEDRQRGQRGNRGNRQRHSPSNNCFSAPNIIQLDYVTICGAHRRRKYGTKLVRKMIDDVYSGYGEEDIECPSIYVECDQQSMLFWRKMGFQVVGIMDHVFDRWKYRGYSMLYHRDNNTLGAIIAYSKQLFQADNTLSIEPLGLSLDFNDDNISNIHFQWSFPPRSMMDVIMYLFKFKWCSYVVDKVERFINFDPDFTYWQLFKMVIKVILIFWCFWMSVPLLIVIGLCRRFKVGAWDL